MFVTSFYKSQRKIDTNLFKYVILLTFICIFLKETSIQERIDERVWRLPSKMRFLHNNMVSYHLHSINNNLMWSKIPILNKTYWPKKSHLIGYTGSIRFYSIENDFIDCLTRYYDLRILNVQLKLRVERIFVHWKCDLFKCERSFWVSCYFSEVVKSCNSNLGFQHSSCIFFSFVTLMVY